MTHTRSILISSVFVSLSLLAAACGDDTGGSGGGGTGGSGSGGDPTTTSGTTTTTGGGTNVCQEVTDFAIPKAAELGCAAVVEADFIQQCEDLYIQAPACTDQIDAFFACALTPPSDGWACDPESNTLTIALAACVPERDAITTCYGG